MKRKICANPFKDQNHRKTNRKIRYQRITENIVKKAKEHNINIILNDLICDCCRLKIYRKQPAIQNTSDECPRQTETAETTLEQPQDILSSRSPTLFSTESCISSFPNVEIEDMEFARKCYNVTNSLHISPIRKEKALDGNVKYGHRKILQAVEALSSDFLHIPVPKVSPATSVDDDKDQGFFSVFKEAFHRQTTNAEKIHMLTALPKEWSQSKMEKKFSISQRMSTQVKELVNKKGHWSYPDYKIPPLRIPIG